MPALLRMIILLTLYFLGGLILKKSQLAYAEANLFWLPPGLALAAILILGYEYWLGVALGAGLFLYVGGVPVGWFMFATAAGNTLVALGGAFLLKRFLWFDSAHERVRGVAAYVLVAGVFGTLLNAAANVAGLVLAGKISWSAAGSNLMAWCPPNALSVFVVAPFFIVWAAPSLWRWNVWRVVELAACVAGQAASVLIALAVWYFYGIHNYPLAYLPVPFLLWGTFRFGPRGAVTGTLVVWTLVFYFLFQGRGLADDAPEMLAGVGTYLCVLALANLLLAVVAAGRLRAEIKLEENEQRLRKVVADQSELICRFRPDGIITFANPAFCNFYDQPEAQLLGANFFEKLSPTEAANLREKLATLPEDQTDWTFDRRAIAAAGHGIWLQYNLRRFTHAASQSSEYQAVIQNVTARKHAEIALQEAKASLEALNLQLRNAVKEANAAAAEANRANAAKSEFLANMSHEIRTPLSGILGMVELLAQTPLDARQLGFAKAATESANALLLVINDVLDFSKIEAGKMTLASENFSVRDIVDSVLENASTREREKRINLASIVRRDVPHRLVGDPTRLRQVLLNLVGNGVKFTEKGEVVVRVQSQMRGAGRVTLRFEVTDTGVGLSPDQAKKLFQPFMQVDTSSSRRFGGSGLGLAISRKIIQLMGGRIGVHSAPGAGSTFWFEVPFAIPPQPAIERSFPGLVFARVFIAIPNASLRESLGERLRGWGVDCRELATSAELLDILRHGLDATVVPVVMCDDEMIERGGTELHQQLVDNQHRIRCILFAGPVAMLNVNQDELAQFASMLLKPVREQTLFDTLVAAITGSKAEALRPVHFPGDTEHIAREKTAKQTPISRLRLLAAEDHPFNRKLWQLMLDNFGVRADWAENGREAVDKFKPGQYDAILMDCNMPGLDGHEATAAIRQLEAEHKVARRVRIIAITANVLVGERERCLAAGMDDYLAKPFTAQQLYQALLAASPAPSANEAEASNPGQLEQLCTDLGRPTVCEMANDFLNDLPDRLKEIHRLHAAGQWPELKRAAHTLKGLFALFGFKAVAEKFQAVEQAADTENHPQTGAALEPLNAAAETAAARLREWRQNQQSAA